MPTGTMDSETAGGHPVASPTRALFESDEFGVAPKKDLYCACESIYCYRRSQSGNAMFNGEPSSRSAGTVRILRIEIKRGRCALISPVRAAVDDGKFESSARNSQGAPPLRHECWRMAGLASPVVDLTRNFSHIAGNTLS